jgi:murein L,D-transpeptidase YafK
MSDRSSWRFAEISDEAAPAKADENDDTDLISERLWTRRNAVALTAGFFALGATGQASAFTQKRRVVADHVVISKKNRVMELSAGGKTFKRYRVNLGFAPDGHKTRSGDGRTPEGRYWINRRNPRSEFYLSLGISYPNAQDIVRAKAMGVNPGGDIFIHGGPNARSTKRRGDWTAGCIAVTDAEMEEIWSLVPTGVPITIFG